MDIKPAYQSALTGIQRGMQGLERAAGEVASAERMNRGEAVSAEPLVDAKVYQRAVEANVKVLKTTNETLGTLLDEMA